MKINICGDFTTMGAGLEAVRRGTALAQEIVAFFKSTDLNIINFESPVVMDKSAAISKSGPNIATTAEAVEYLRRCHIHLVTLANNHFYDYGRHGVSETIQTLKAYGIDYVGGGETTAELSRIYYAEEDGIRVAILNYCESEFSVVEGVGSNPLNPIQVFKDLQAAKEKSDYRIVICHGGHEGYQLPSPRMKEWYRFFVDSGANIVCNHHQHCFSGSETYHGGTIFYGLGNFFFDDYRPKRNRSTLWNYGYIVSLDMNSQGIQSRAIPYKQCLDSKETTLLHRQEAALFEKEMETLSAIIADEKILSEEFDKWCASQQGNVITCFSPYSNRILNALCRRNLLPNFITRKKRLVLYNAIRCEAHRDVAINVLRINK